ncbi:hypothetical protein [Nocardia carnea]|uniref:hypothetical protein n=1 Tax=Nocardia carnea TaxID=37328 RepID=UPI002458FE4A|nr:hypothetical protein [Nocardia carnea]
MDKHNLLQNKHIPLRFPIQKFRSAMEIATSVDPDMSAGRVGPDPSSALPLLVQMMTGEP